MLTIRTPQAVALKQMLLFSGTDTKIPEIYQDPLGAVYKGQIFCWHCLMKEDLSQGTIDPFFSSSAWSFIPKCCRCRTELVMLMKHTPPKFTLNRDQIVYNKESKEAGEIIRWVSGTFSSNYRYQVRCASDGAIEIWHREDISLDIQGVDWK